MVIHQFVIKGRSDFKNQSVAGEPDPQSLHPRQVFCSPGWKLAKNEVHF